MAKEYDKAFHIIFDNNLVELLDRWGNYSLLIDIYSKMLPEDHFGDEILLENKGEHSIILGNLGNAYSNLGDPRKAIEYYEQALKIDKEMEDRQGEGVWLGNLGLAY
jgi:tetratricopeptide (TPR) repeat protein